VNRASQLRRSPMKRGSGLSPMSAKRRNALAAAGVPLTSTFAPRARTSNTPPVRTKSPAYTGPKRSVCDLVDARSGKRCEFPACANQQDHRHHRLNRKAGGRHGEMRERLNSAAWLLGVCAVHHEIVTNPVGELRKTVERMGWVLREGQDATAVEVATRHHAEPVFLDNAGQWHTYEEWSA
jgi:hypothetical protein